MMNTTRRARTGWVLASLAVILSVQPAFSQLPDAASPPHPHSIVSISVSAADNPAAPPCPAGTPESAVAPDGTALNCYGGLETLSDEHFTIFPPGALPGHSDYLFFVASRTNLNPDASGLTVLTGGSGPDAAGRWTLDYAPDFGQYNPAGAPGSQNGQIFLTGMDHAACPVSPNWPDVTFDLNYAAPGTVLVDPTNRSNSGPGALLMIYEGTNRCLGISRAKVADNQFYSSIGVASSLDGGRSWPAYQANFFPLPGTNPALGPGAPEGAFASAVCLGNDCSTVPPAGYGRYSVLTTKVTPGDAMTLAAGGLLQHAGDSEPSAFVDDVSTSPFQYLYVVHGYSPGLFACDSCSTLNPSISPPYDLTSDLTIARAQLNGGTSPLTFSKWHQGSFSEPGRGEDGGGRETPIFAVDPNGYANCLAPDQARAMGAISYVEQTQQYLLTFVCSSPSDPASTSDPGSGESGAAWFYSTLDAIRYDLSNQDQWSRPVEIAGSWTNYTKVTDVNGQRIGCFRNFDGWYPTFMSLNRQPGHLSLGGYVFYMNGCTDETTPNGRRFSSRAFTIATQ